MSSFSIYGNEYIDDEQTPLLNVKFPLLPFSLSSPTISFLFFFRSDLACNFFSFWREHFLISDFSLPFFHLQLYLKTLFVAWISRKCEFCGRLSFASLWSEVIVFCDLFNHAFVVTFFFLWRRYFFLFLRPLLFGFLGWWCLKHSLEAPKTFVVVAWQMLLLLEFRCWILSSKVSSLQVLLGQFTRLVGRALMVGAHFRSSFPYACVDLYTKMNDFSLYFFPFLFFRSSHDLCVLPFLIKCWFALFSVAFVFLITGWKVAVKVLKMPSDEIERGSAVHKFCGEMLVMSYVSTFF